ncbi:Glycerol-3-phosphate regulon repressor [Planctomycetes bacterium MalM25]|nr:Glycerol-3-phosphate regulon repressor [Planctomycetes bacterium MalM25]
MLATERRSQILQLLDSSGAVQVTRLAEDLEVTDETIRRDLAKLMDEGLAVRTHGGAVRPEAGLHDAPFAQRQVMNVEAKRAIATEAAKLVQPGDVIGIDASTTGFELARILRNLTPSSPITVVSNGLDVAKVLAGRDGFRIISTGGELDNEGTSFTGTIAESSLRQFALRRAFMSCKGFDKERGPSEASLDHAAIKRTMLSAADESILLVDTSKIGLPSICFVAEPASYTRIVTESSEQEALK